MFSYGFPLLLTFWDDCADNKWRRRPGWCLIVVFVGLKKLPNLYFISFLTNVSRGCLFLAKNAAVLFILFFYFWRIEGGEWEEDECPKRAAEKLLNIYLFVILELLFKAGTWQENGPRLKIAYRHPLEILQFGSRLLQSW